MSEIGHTNWRSGGLKKCLQGEWRPAEDFGVDRSSRDGRQPTCREHRELLRRLQPKPIPVEQPSLFDAVAPNGKADAIIYFALDPNTRLTKIGSTKRSVKARLREAATWAPDVRELASWYAPRESERWVHDRLAAWREAREWFALPPLACRHIEWAFAQRSYVPGLTLEQVVQNVIGIIEQEPRSSKSLLTWWLGEDA